jgi:hypothetical protein
MPNSWDFTEENTKNYTHGFHTYPAMMIPQVAKKLIEAYGKKDKLLFDPYCGTGTSLVEANMKGINAIGTDLNPMARLVAKAKTTIISQQNLDLVLKDFNDFLFQFRYGFRKKDSVVAPQFANIDFWFSKNIKNDLSIVKEYIDKIEDTTIKNFFEVAFSQTIRDCSWTRKNEFKLYKMDSEKIKTFKPEVFTNFEKTLCNNRKGLLDLIQSKKNDAFSHIYDFNTVKYIPSDLIHEKSVDLVVTSPPYGDSQTTVAYGQFSRLANQWLGYENSQKLDASLMGGTRPSQIEKFENKTLNKQINQIKSIDEIKRNGHACYVVSNRCVRGVTLKTDRITREFFEENGLNHIGTFDRKISSKRMPRKNSPAGIVGKTKTLMNKEYIIVMQKR